jgi:hypothetical protein
MRARSECGELLSTSIYRKTKGYSWHNKIPNDPHFMSHIKGIKRKKDGMWSSMEELHLWPATPSPPPRGFLGPQSLLENFWDFSGIKTGNVPELSEPLWLLFAEEKHCSGIVLECVQSCFSGYWNYSKTHRNIFGINGHRKLSS